MQTTLSPTQLHRPWGVIERNGGGFCQRLAAAWFHGATETIDAIADDGTAWWMVPGEVDWTQLPPLPRSEG